MTSAYSSKRAIFSLRLRPLICALALPAAVQAQELATEPPLPAAPLSAPAESAPAERIVKEVDVRFTGSSTVDRARVLSNMRLKTGEVYTKEKEEDDLRALYSSGDFTSDVRIETVDVAGGVKIIVTGEARAAMGDLSFSGNTIFNSDRLRDEVDFKAGGVVDDIKLNEARAKISELYKNKGYPDTTVTYSVEPGNRSGFSRIVFNIDEGGRGVINDVLFEGNSAFSASRLRGVTSSDDRNWLKIWDLKRKLDRDKVQQDMTAIQEFYGNHGYFDARVTGVDPMSVGDKVNLVFRISEGQQYTTAEVNVTGNKIFDNAQLIPVFQLEAGKVFSLADMKSDIETITDFYGSRGYAEAKVTPRVSRQNGQIAITYAIEEGGQFKVGKINVSGNQETRTDVILREMAIDPGDDYNTIKIKKSMSRLRGLDYFEENNGVDFMPVTSASGPDYKDLNVTVNEKKTGTVQFGAGFSSIDSIVGMVEISQKNFDATNWPSFTGGGQRFRMNLRAGTRRKDFLLSLTEPYFMGQRLAVGGDLFWTEKTYLSDYYDQREAGVTLHMRKPLTDNVDMRVAYTLQQVEIYDMDQKASPELLAEEGKFTQSRLSGSLVYDTRNSIQAPSKGEKLSFEAAFSGLGGDVESYNLTLSGQKYWEMPWETVFSVEGKLAVVDALGGGNVPIFEREFLGGARDLRGFDYRDVGPRDANGEPIGGGTSGWITFEYTVPVVSSVRAAVFTDLGFVNRDSWDFSTGDFNADVGFGVRLKLPVLGPIKLDYGIPVTSDKFNDGGGRFQFSVDYKY